MPLLGFSNGGNKNKKTRKEKKRKISKIVAYGASTETVCTAPLGPIILQGIHHSQKKFDSVEEYQKRGEKATDEYTTNLIQEVRKQKQHTSQPKQVGKTYRPSNVMM